MRIVYYVHHHGSGHLHHARRLASLGVAEVVSVGTHGTDIVLAPDVDPTRPHRQRDDNPFHWTPATPTVRRRFAGLHEALVRVDPDLVMVDVSVEAAVFAHLCGWPVAHRHMPGTRDDEAHDLLRRTVERLFAYYPRAVEQPGFAFGERTSWLGMLSDAAPAPARLSDPRTVVVLSGAGGDGVGVAELVRAASSTPGHHWHVLGPQQPTRQDLPANLHLHGWVDDPRPWLERAGRVVCGAGHNTIATVAGLRRAPILVPEPRPHDEQAVFARSLHRVAGVPLTTWADAEWPTLLATPGDPEALARTLLVDRATFAERTRDLLATAAGRTLA